MANLDWLVVRDLVDDRERHLLEGRAGDRDRRDQSRRQCRTEVFFFPAASHVEKEGTFTQTQRMLQWREKAVEPPGDAALGAVVLLPPGPPAPGEAGRLDRRARPAAAGPGLGLRDRGHRRTSPSAEDVLRHINGYRPDHRPRGRRLHRASRPTARRRAAAGSTAACTPTGSTRPRGASRASSRTRTTSEWGWTWPMNRRVLYNRASADPQGRPWSERKKLVWWDPERQGEWTGHDVPDFEKTKPPDYRPPAGGGGSPRRCAATTRSSCRPTARPGCSRPTAWSTGRCRRTTSRTSRRCATRCTASRATRRARSTAARTTRRTRRRRRRTARCSRSCSPPRGSPSTTPRAG